MKSFDAFKSSPFFSLKHSTYFDVYDYLFSSYVGKTITFLEIGVLNGGSLFMWREFFGPQARIIGVDLNPEVVVWRDYGFEIYIGSQNDPKFWETLVTQLGPIDIVLDDGGHTFLQQITTVDCLLNAIVPNGLIVIEDTHTSYMKEFAPKFKSTFMDYAFSIIHGINYRHGGFGAFYEKNIYSVQFFESIVAFRIDPAKCIVSSIITNNENTLGYDARDYRYGSNNLITSVALRLNRFPLVYSISRWVYLKLYLIPLVSTKKLKNMSERKKVKEKIKFVHKKY